MIIENLEGSKIEGPKVCFHRLFSHEDGVQMLSLFCDHKPQAISSGGKGEYWGQVDFLTINSITGKWLVLEDTHPNARENCIDMLATSTLKTYESTRQYIDPNSSVQLPCQLLSSDPEFHHLVMIPYLSHHIIDNIVDDTNNLIAMRKGVRACTKHPISKFLLWVSLLRFVPVFLLCHLCLYHKFGRKYLLNLGENMLGTRDKCTG